MHEREITTYQPRLRFNDYLTVGDHGRTGVFMKTDSCDVLLEKVQLGWSFEETRGGFWLRAPDISVVDITEPFRTYQLGDAVTNLACYRRLKDLQSTGMLTEVIDRLIKTRPEHYANFDYYISEGPVLEAEMRIGGSDRRVSEIRKDLFTRLLSEDGWNDYLEQAREFLGEIRQITIRNGDVNSLGDRSANLVRYLTEVNKVVYPQRNWFDFEMIDHLTEQLPSFDILIFVPTGCYRYMSSFLKDEIVDKIMLWEVHTDRHETRTCKILAKELKSKRCLIIDKSYTGTTLNDIADLVRQEEGEPTRLALFPKSRMGIQNSDYVLFLDKILESDKMSLERPEWPEFYYREVLAKEAILIGR